MALGDFFSEEEIKFCADKNVCIGCFSRDVHFIRAVLSSYRCNEKGVPLVGAPRGGLRPAKTKGDWARLGKAVISIPLGSTHMIARVCHNCGEVHFLYREEKTDGR